MGACRMDGSDQVSKLSLSIVMHLLIRSLLESKSRTCFQNSSTSLPHNDSPKMEIWVTTTTVVQIETLPFDWTLFSGTTAVPTSIPSELTLDSASLDGHDAVKIPSDWDIESQNTVLCGVGQWADCQDSFSRSRQSLSNPTDDAEDPKLDLTGLHALASRTPFEQYLQLRKVEAGTSSLQPYSALLCTI